MKRILLAILALALALPMQGQTALRGKRFTDSELLNAFPKGIVEPAPYPMGFVDGKTLRFQAAGCYSLRSRAG